MNLHLGKMIAPPRFIAFVLLFVAGGFFGQQYLGLGRGLMAGFDGAAWIFLLSLAPLFRAGEAAKMRQAADRNDANRVGLLAITGLTMLVILVAVAKELHGKSQPLVIGLVIATLVTAWIFSNTIYALHYAHLFYGQEKGKDAGGIDFPNCNQPDYWDFVYFSYTLGMTFQTSDVQITSRHIRKVVIGHTLAAFVYNLGVLAFTINTIGGG